MDLESVATITGSVLGGGVVGALASAWVARYTARRNADNADGRLAFDRDQWMSEAQQKLVDQAMGFLTPYEEENAKLAARVVELQQLIQIEQTARRRDAADCKQAINEIGITKDREIGMLQAKVTVLQNQIVNLKGQNTHLRKRISYLERGTGDLKTPPPHTLPNWQEPPPPVSDDPADWE